MPKLASFPFTFIGSTRLGKIYRPYAIISAFAKARKTWQPLEMVIDTGADYTLLPKQYAFILGVDVKKDCVMEKTIGIGGMETVYQYQRLPIRIGLWEQAIPVGFLNRNDIPPLLGRLGCTELLRLHFEMKTSVFEIQKI